MTESKYDDALLAVDLPELNNRDEMLDLIRRADPEASIVVVVEGVGLPKGGYVMLRSRELRPGVARAVWDGIQSAFNPVGAN